MPHLLSYAAIGGTQYTLTLKNNAAAPWNFYVYQTMPQQSANVFSTAWFCSPFMIAVGAQITFTWTVDYSMVWGATGTVRPGVTFNASQVVSANLTTNNASTFTTQPAPSLSSPVQGTPSGSLIISDDNTVPSNTFTVGIGMSGTGTFVTQAGPNLTHIFTPTPTYWIAAGTNVQVGTILNIATVNQNSQVQFPANVFALTYSLNTLNQWVAA